jgi:hypothetical protein
MNRTEIHQPRVVGRHQIDCRCEPSLGGDA